jgi:dipeptidyl aminopeptidase/acylaminoacyl peptidase
VPVAGGEVRNLTAGNPADDEDPVWSPDGRRLAYGLQKKADGWPDRTRLAVLAVSTGATTVLTEPFDYSATGWTWSADGRRIVFHAEVRGRTNLYTIPAAGGTPTEIVHGGTTAGADAGASGEVVFQQHGLDTPPEIGVVRLDGSGLRRLTHVNDELMAGVARGPVEDLTFKGAGNDDVQMFVVKPPGFDPSRKYPLVQLVHGGPVGTFGDAFSFRWNPHAFAAPGYVVALVNFHGSSSFGQAWVESILGAHPDKPFTDVMKATDHLIAQGYVDPSRMAAAGGSYGGFLVNWIAGHTDRFKALVSHAGVYSLLGQSASDTTYGRQHSYGGYPFTNLANVERWSPNRFAANFRTPMLILHGERDFRVPVGQGLELYGVLTAKGVPARLVYYPDENHWILKGQNAKHWYGEVLGWLARWLDSERNGAGTDSGR